MRLFIPIFLFFTFAIPSACGAIISDETCHLTQTELDAFEEAVKYLAKEPRTS